jgi:multisubunit Na+/H+ antiporter MnhF subunit
MNGNNIWHRSFDGCVVLLQTAAEMLDPYVPGGMDYVKINVILFCIILPIVLGASIALNVALIMALL